MGKYTGLLLCSDFDGTLCHHGKVSRETLEAIAYFQQNGGRFTLATGRYPDILSELNVPLCCNAPLICMNGAILYDGAEDRYLYEGKMSAEYADILLEILCESKGIRDLRICSSDTRRAEAIPLNDKGAIRVAMHRKPYKILLHVDTEYSDHIKEKATRLSGARYAVSRSWINGIEIQEAYYDKGKTARRLAKLLHADKLICVGDYENDLSMIREADLGVAMGNAVDSLKEAADLVTATAEENGVARLIESL